MDRSETSGDLNKSYIDILPKGDLTSLIYWPLDALVEIDSQNLRNTHMSTVRYYRMIYDLLVNGD